MLRAVFFSFSSALWCGKLNLDLLKFCGTFVFVFSWLFLSTLVLIMFTTRQNFWLFLLWLIVAVSFSRIRFPLVAEIIALWSNLKPGIPKWNGSNRLLRTKKIKKIWKSFAVIEKSKNLFFGSINFLRRKRQKHHGLFQVNLTKNETSNIRNEEINLNSVLSDLFTTDLGRLRKMNVVERLYVTPSRFNSYNNGC